MERLVTPFTNPSPEQQRAWRIFNEALGQLAAAHEVDADQLNESVGPYTEEVVSVLMDKPETAA